MNVRSCASVLFGLFLAACASAPPRSPVTAPASRPETFTLFLHVCSAAPCEKDNEPLPNKLSGVQVEMESQGTVYVEHADGVGNLIVPDLVAGTRTFCVGGAGTGYKRTCVAVTFPRAEGQDEFLVAARDVPPLERLRIDGRYLVTAAGATYRGRFVTEGAILARSAEERDAILDQLAAKGVDGIRVFAGDVGWAPQTIDSARAALPGLLDAAGVRGLRVIVSALTGTAIGYDAEAHLRAIAAIVLEHDNASLEAANEPYHVTQSALLHDFNRFAEMTRRAVPPGLWYTLGAPEYDELQKVDASCEQNCATYWPQPVPGGVIDLHLARERDLFNNVRRVKEMAEVASTTKRPVISSEPKGIADAPIPGKDRLVAQDAESWAFTYGALCRGFDLGICVLHPENGLQGHLLAANELRDVDAFADGAKAIETDARLQFFNAGWPGSPVRGGVFTESYGQRGIVRAYSFVSGGRGWTVLIGKTGDPAIEWGDGWRPVRVVAERPGVQVVEIAR